MKKKLPLVLAVAFIHLIFFISAQAPQGLNYQAVVRNASGAVIGNTTVSIKFEVHDSIPAGVIVYQETHSVQTNQFGLVSLILGSGGNLSSVNWGHGSLVFAWSNFGNIERRYCKLDE